MPTWKFVNPLGELAVPLGLSVMKREYALFSLLFIALCWKVPLHLSDQKDSVSLRKAHMD